MFLNTDDDVSARPQLEAETGKVGSALVLRSDQAMIRPPDSSQVVFRLTGGQKVIYIYSGGNPLILKSNPQNLKNYSK